MKEIVTDEIKAKLYELFEQHDKIVEEQDEYIEQLRERNKHLQSENARLKAEKDNFEYELIEENKSLKVAIETNRIRLLRYENLRKCFSQLTNLVLGENYYNESCDVYRADEYTCRDIWEKMKPLFSKRKWRGV